MMEFFDEAGYLMTPPGDGRVEAIAKVTGKGKYAAEYKVEDLCYGVLVGSTIAAGTIKKLKLEDARQSSGVIDIITQQHRPEVPGFADEARFKESRFGLPLFYTDKIYFKGQPIALVIAGTLEEATYAASLVSAEYNIDSFKVDFDKSHVNVALEVTGKDRGNVELGNNAPHIIESEYNIKAEVHNPMEMHATIAEWTDEGKLRLYDKNQGVNSVQQTFAKLFNMPEADIQVTSEFVGGGFGSGLRAWPHVMAAIMGAKLVKRPLKLMLTRPQMFNMVGHRPQSWQKVKLAADNNGKFVSVLHQAKHSTSMYENFNEGITRITRLIYNFENLRTQSAIVPLNLGAPTWMRGPGDCTGDFAIESAIDELSYKLQQDPVELRLKNLALIKDPETGKPWSSNFIRECMERGAAMINWKSRSSKPGEQTDGDLKIGYGMALGMWNAGRNNASAAVSLQKTGLLTVKTAMTDIGTGTGTAMLNMAHTATGISKANIKIELGNSDLPPAPRQGGSTGLSSLSGAIAAAVDSLKLKLAVQAAKQMDVYKNAPASDILLSDNGISYKTANNQFISYNDIWEKGTPEKIEAEESSGPGAERKQYSFCSSAAHFCIVKVNSNTGKVRIEKMVCVADGGRIINEKPAANQVAGAAVGGIGMALMEELLVDTNTGSLIGNDLAGYHFAVNADAPFIEVEFINKPDPNINPNGAKGLGEVGIIGVAAAITNAIFNATGKRMRDLPVTPEKILNS